MQNDDTTYDFCFVISDMLSTTPRAFRAIEALLQANYSVFLVFNQRVAYGIEYNQQILKQLCAYERFDYKRIVWHNRQIKTILHKILHKIAIRLFDRFNSRNLLFLACVIDFASVQQALVARTIKARCYAGHRASSLPAIKYAAVKNKAATWFDIEDFHCEESDDKIVNERITKLTQHIPADYYTDASRLIGSAYLQATHQPQQTSTEILNSPAFDCHLPPDAPNGIARFFWFSQHISFHRGLEEFLEARQHATAPCELHLVGKMNKEFEQYIHQNITPKTKLHLYGFVPEHKLIAIATACDFGLATELANINISRNLSITNKILTYTVCGLYIVATNTSGQTDFIRRLPNNGALITPTPGVIVQTINQLVGNVAQIRQQRYSRQLAAQSVTWNEQREILLSFVKNITTAKH